MCGLIGYSGKDKCDIEKIKILMYINSIERGLDATGLYSPVNGLNRSLSQGWSVATSATTNLKEDNLIIAHVRAKTVGVSSIANTHPFRRGNYILAHNGTLRNYGALKTKYGIVDPEAVVDSDIVTACLEKSDNFDVLKQLDGAAALLITDKRNPNTLYVFRKGAKADADTRPLFKGNFNGNMYISSIAESLILIGCSNVKEFKFDTLYTIENGLIVKTKPIKNTPYAEPVSIPTYGSNNDDNPLIKAVGGWLRSRQDHIIYCKTGLNYKFHKGVYYMVTALLDNNTVRVNHGMDDSVELALRHFMTEDIIQQGDYVIALSDIYSTYAPFAQKCKKGDIFKVSISYGDGDVSVLKPKSDKFDFMAKRNYFRKLTAAQKAEYLNSLESSNIISTETNLEADNKEHARQMALALGLGAALEESENQLKVIHCGPEQPRSSDGVIYEKEEVDDLDKDEDDYHDLEINSKELSDTLDYIDMLAEEMNEIYNKDEAPYDLGNKIIELMDFIQVTRNYYIQPENIMK